MHLTSNMSVSQALVALLKTEKKRITVTGVSAVCCVIAELMAWLCIYVAMIQAQDGQHPFLFLALMAVAICLRYFFYALSLWQAHLAAYQMIQKVRQKLVTALSEMPTIRLMQYHRGELEKRLSDDCQSIEPLIAHHTTDILIGILLPVVLIGLMTSIDWQLAIIALTPLPLAILVQMIMMRGFSARQKKYNDVVANMHKAQLEFLRSIGVMKLFGVDADSYRQLNVNMTKHHKLVNTYTKQAIGAWVTFMTLAQISLVLIIPFAINKTVQGTLTLTDLAMTVILCAGILKPWLDLTQIFAQVQQSVLSIERLLPLFPESNNSPSEAAVEPCFALTCKNLCVKRDELEVVDALDLTFSPGDCAVIQGASGAGKSSLLATLYGELQPVQGDWFINNHAVSAMTDQQRSQYVAVVDQHPEFFNASIRDNLTLDNPLIDDPTIFEVLNILGLSKLIEQLPGKLDYYMGETERNFSGGEIQRLAIARAILVQPPILVLDEATSHLDKLTEKKVLAAISQYDPQQIQFVISHGQQALTIADRAFSLSAGQLIEIDTEGTPCA